MLSSLPHRWLDPLPELERDERHRYRVGNHVFPISVTGVLAASKSDFAKKRMEETRHLWEARGNNTHKALELASTDPDWHPDDWPTGWPFMDWIWPMLSHPLWNEAYVVASEMGLYSMEQNVVGTFDGAYLIRSPSGQWRRILFDLKTQGKNNASTYDTRPQLGGYLSMALEHGIAFDGAATLWARPGKTVLKTYGINECLDGWTAALAAYRGQSDESGRILL